MIPLFVCLALFIQVESVAGATIHVDPSLPGNCAGTYDPAVRSCGGGNAVAYKTLQDAAAATQAGDNVLIRGGTYQGTLAPPRSGAPGSIITFRSHPGETAILSNVGAPAISLVDRSYLSIEELTVTDALGWGRVERSRHIIIRNNRFSKATARGTTGGLKFVKSAYNKVLNNTFDGGHDSLVLQESDRNLVQGNTFNIARHSLVSIRCGNFNVLRGNRFYNPDQKAAEIYDCEGTSDAPVKYNATKYNLFEKNTFAYTKASDRDYRYNGIQYGGQNGIVRRNVFHDNQGGALNFQVYSSEALHNNRNHVYNNSFYHNRCYGLVASGSPDSSRYFGNIVKNNIFYGNVDCSGREIQTLIGNPKAVRLESNAIVKSSPLFESESARNLRLMSGSPMIDAGAFATRTVGRSSGNVMPVEDAGYFFDGFGIPGEAGDIVQLEGQLASARIIGIDYGKNVLTLDSQLSWENGQNLHLRFSGARPDMGAYEYNAAGTGSR